MVSKTVHIFLIKIPQNVIFNVF